MWGFFELRILEIFTRAFFIKNHYLNFTLSVVTLSKIKPNHKKDVSDLKKILHIKRYKIDIIKGEK